jgi:hypothetical protein
MVCHMGDGGAVVGARCNGLAWLRSSLVQPEARRDNDCQGVNMTILQVLTRAAMLFSVIWGSLAAQGQAFAPGPAAPVFWTHQAKTEFASLGLAIAVDGLATQYVLNSGGREYNPIARPMVTRGPAGQVQACVLGFAAGVGISYALHRTGHPRAAVLARHLTLLGETATAAFTFVNSYHSQGGELWQQQH